MNISLKDFPGGWKVVKPVSAINGGGSSLSPVSAKRIHTAMACLYGPSAGLVKILPSVSSSFSDNSLGLGAVSWIIKAPSVAIAKNAVLWGKAHVVSSIGSCVAGIFSKGISVPNGAKVSFTTTPSNDALAPSVGDATYIEGFSISGSMSYTSSSQAKSIPMVFMVVIGAFASHNIVGTVLMGGLGSVAGMTVSPPFNLVGNLMEKMAAKVSAYVS
ncbi:MAG: hypothetical protein M1152_05660 [Actinobacteria bacterium]|nr:hypothetical protein [Actinomycetota bacterium]